ncbi:MAG: SH3 domain-containing protein [Clostridia bacterium]|nr:SH3 domain-containing protein [Clostridia bacterium]
MFNLRKILTSFSVGVLLVGLCVGAGFASGSKTGVITGDGLNLRESPDTSSKVLTKLSKNTQVTIISDSNGWYKVSYDGKTGWISGQYVTVKVVKEPEYGVITGDDVNVRDNPSTSSDVKAQLSEDTKVEILDETDGWCKVKAGSVTGWVSRKYVSINNGQSATINADDVNLRKSPSTTSEVVHELYEGEKVSVLESSGDWMKVKTLDGKSGWVFKGFVSVNKTQKTSRSVENVVTQTAPEKDVDESKPSADESQIVSYAKKFLGVKYVYGGSSPKGFDCSGFVLYVYDKFGINLNRVAADQAKQGTRIKKAELKPGDLVFFDTNGGHNYINHVGMYIGNGKFIHASSGRSTHRVTISDLTDGFYANAYMTARRFVK